MKLTLQVESAKHRSTSGDERPSTDTRDRVWSRLEDAWRQANVAGIDVNERQRRLNWLGGAIVVYSLFTGEDANDVRSRVEATSPAIVPSSDPGVPVFREGRSTPPPPRHPGAQHAVE